MCIDGTIVTDATLRHSLPVAPPKRLWYDTNPRAKRRRPQALPADVLEYASNKSVYIETIAQYLAQTASKLPLGTSLPLLLALFAQPGTILHQGATIPAMRPEVDQLLSSLQLQPLPLDDAPSVAALELTRRCAYFYDIDAQNSKLDCEQPNHPSPGSIEALLDQPKQLSCTGGRRYAALAEIVLANGLDCMLVNHNQPTALGERPHAATRLAPPAMAHV